MNGIAVLLPFLEVEGSSTVYYLRQLKQFFMLFQQYVQTIAFKKWILQDQGNRLSLRIFIIMIVGQFIWFKFLYPFPNFMPPDSDSYIEAAYYNYPINMWAIGYSKFLRLVSSFTNSHWVLVWLQYLILQTCLLFFLYTLRYLLSLGNWIFCLLVVCSVLNPLIPHISNFVSSDALFAALSLLWFTQLLWILYKPSRWLLAFHAFVLLFAFMVRYNALFYPFISIAIIAFTNLSVKYKLVSISFILILLGAFVGRTQHKYYTYMGTAQYSGFSGWLMAGNALYGYAYAKPDSPEEIPARFRQLHTIVNHHMDSLSDLLRRPDDEVAIYYVWNEKSPLKEYLRDEWRGDSITPYFKRWASMAPLYMDYGRYLIKRHPILFIRYYVWPNLVKYYAPPSKFLGVYNLEEPTVAPRTAAWFGWKDNRISTRYKDTKIFITRIFTIMMAVINLIYILSFIAFIYLGGLRRSSPYAKNLLWWMFSIWISNVIFSVLSAPIELRYQLFPMIITFVFSVLLVEWMISEHPLTVVK